MFKHGLIKDSATVLDYGCGRGDDVRQLRDLSVNVVGWDPHFAPDQALEEAEIVNLGYVVNVIESPSERMDVIQKAFSLSTKLLVVSGLTGSPSYSSNVKTYGDGVITSTGTFQRYFRQDELTDLVKSSIDREPISVGPGVLFVFSDSVAQQEFLAQRLASRARAPRRQLIKSVEELSNSARAQADRYWQTCLALGRPAKQSDIQDCPDLFNAVPSHRSLFDIVANEHDKGDFELARQSRRNKLLVDFALAHSRRSSISSTFRNLSNTMSGSILELFSVAT